MRVIQKSPASGIEPGSSAIRAKLKPLGQPHDIYSWIVTIEYIQNHLIPNCEDCKYFGHVLRTYMVNAYNSFVN